MQRYGRQPEGPPLSPKSRLVHIILEEPPASPGTVLDRTPVYGIENGQLELFDEDLDDGMYTTAWCLFCIMTNLI